MTCKYICMSFDGDYVSEGYFNSVDDAWQHGEDLGSKWFFFPFHFVLTKSGKTIKDAGWGMEEFIGKRLKTVRKIFNTVSELPETQNDDPDMFLGHVYDYLTK